MNWRVLDRMGGLDATTDIAPVLSLDELEELRQAVDAVYVDPKVKAYIVDVVRPRGSRRTTAWT